MTGPFQRESVLRWLRQPWVGGAVLAVALEFIGFWTLSPRAVERWPVPGPGRTPLTSSNSVPLDLPGLLWVWTPALSMAGGREDFSAAAWMEPESPAVQIEAFAVPEHAMPFRSARDEGTVMPAMESGRPDPSPVAQWGAGTEAMVRPKLEGKVGSTELRLRVVTGLKGWAPSPATPVVAGPAMDPITTPGMVLRLILDGKGELVTPPIVWESSGQAGVDEAVLGLARRLRWVKAPGAAAAGTTASEREWGLVLFEWGGRPPS